MEEMNGVTSLTCEIFTELKKLKRYFAAPLQLPNEYPLQLIEIIISRWNREFVSSFLSRAKVENREERITVCREKNIDVNNPVANSQMGARTKVTMTMR
jgi:hypothetical protein